MPRPSACRLARLPSCDGIGPLNWLLPRLSNSKLARLPSSDGIGPLNWLLARLSNLRLSRLPSSDGIDPLNWLPSSPSPFEVGEVAQFRRYRPAQLVAVEPQQYPGWRGCPVPTVSTRSTGCRRAPVPGCRGYPVPTVSARSTGCRRAQPFEVGEVAQFRRYRPAQLVAVELTAYPGWRGCPVPTVSARSTGCRRATALPG